MKSCLPALGRLPAITPSPAEKGRTKELCLRRARYGWEAVGQRFAIDAVATSPPNGRIFPIVSMVRGRSRF
jgi:hypothetical protein